jgi:cell wall-associated NlpC family hydrolase
MVEYSPNGRLGDLRVRAVRYIGRVAEAVRSGSITLDIAEVATLNLTVADPALGLAGARLFDPGGAVVYQDLGFTIQSCEFTADSGVPHQQVVARSVRAQKLRKAPHYGARVWTNRSPTQVVTELARSVGHKVIGQPSATRPSIARGADESSWTLIGRLAEEMGWMAFESVDGIYFGSRAALIARTGAIRRPVVWDRWNQATTGELLDFPTVRRSDDSRYAADLSFTVMGPNADQWRLGDIAVLDGVPGFYADYLVTGVDIPLSDDPVTVSAQAAKLLSSNTITPGAIATAARFTDAALRNAQPTPMVLPEESTLDASNLVAWALAQVGVRFPLGSDSQLAYCLNRESTITVTQALAVRGALLFNQRRVALSLGDGRVVEATSEDYVVVARPASTWTVGALVPGVKYPVVP